MQFYPHNIPLTSTENSVSASKALTSSFINNIAAFGATLINTASVALNITGSPGTNGINYVSIGPTGPAGIRGVTGFRGNSIYLLSSSWSGSNCVEESTCNGPYTLYNIGPGFDECNTTQGSGIYYSNAELNEITSGNILFLNSGCTVVASNVAVHDGGNIFYTDPAGVISITGCKA
jgi:hypothetical protein